ncbi:MAG: N-6 DNA methylase [Candidatus Izemoplasmatales bacterium]|nr:N-6 DNA methylase [Candidatus Izemoplasmatales bacterium]
MINEKRNEHISNLIVKQIHSEDFEWKNEIIAALEVLLNGHFEKYKFDLSVQSDIKKDAKVIEMNLSKFNEITKSRKSKGTYYTPQDLTNYINLNAILMTLLDDNQRTYKDYTAFELILGLDEHVIEDFLYTKTIFDPTCGSGEFLINAAEIKLNILQDKFEVDDEKVLKIAKTIFGNDINDESVDIAMYRLFNTFIKKITNFKNYTKLSKIIVNNFTTYDFVYYKNEIKNKFDIIIGNPPYVEYGKYKEPRNEKLTFGNVYADVVHNTIPLVRNNGAFGYVLPLSYVATNRMKKLREIVIENFSTQFVLNFADRPDCLFPGVHQKLNIVIAKKGKAEHKLYTSRYNFWRKSERKKLLNGCEIIRVFNGSPNYIPKIGNNIEESIFRKIRTVTNNNIYDNQVEDGTEVFINMRAAFWIKSFTFNPGSNEYKKFIFPKLKKGFILSVLNSSLYWMFWTMVSDGWHITSKELKEFLVPDKDIDYELFDKLSLKLENKLEKTKKYIGSKQTEYEYKHKDCKNVIDEIDDALASIYELTEEEVRYIKNFSMTYRMGEKND